MGPTIEEFAAWLGAPCEVEAAGVRVPMQLIAAQPIDGSPRAAGGFRLEFEGPAEPVLDQAIMAVRSTAGQFDIFMVPIGRTSGGTRYEAIFN